MDVAPFLALETQVWDALVSGDSEAASHLIAEDFLGVYPFGFMGRDARAEVLAASGPVIAAYELHDARLIVVSDTDVLICYRARSRVMGTEESAPMDTVYISSLWSRRGDHWLNVFSQDTTAI